MKKKSSALKRQLSEKRVSMCGIGTRKLKLFLNKKVKDGDGVAFLYRTAIEAEDASICAKKYFGEYRDHYYDKKALLITSLIALCQSRNDVKFGYQNSDDPTTSHVVFFDLPGCEQISFHCNLSREMERSIPYYSDCWDGKVNSTLPKLEQAVFSLYGAELSQKAIQS